MGQRLNIEIVKNGDNLANAYYHWSAYTSPSLAMVQIILDNLEKVQEENDILYAIRLLEKTGALLTDDEIAKFTSLFGQTAFKQAQNRNDGLIAFTKDGMEETREWEEHRVVINLDEECIGFDVIWKDDKDSFLEGYEKSESEYKDLPILDINFDWIPFGDFERVANQIKDFLKKEVYHLRTSGDEVISFIA